MKNTKVLYASFERMPVVLPEMEELLPPLGEEQFSSLEEDILENGCYSPIIVNEDLTVIDGHNRLRICQKHGLPFKMLVFSFADLLEAKQWALDTQKSRRNMTLWDLGQIALKLKPELEARRRQGARTDLSVNSPRSSHTDTRKEMARAVGIGEQSMGRIAQLEEQAPQILKDALRSDQVSLNRAWEIMKVIRERPPEEQDAAVTSMLEGYHQLDKQSAEADRRGRIAAQFSRAYEKASLLDPTEENICCWIESCRMTPGEVEENAQESYELARVFQRIGDILNSKAESLMACGIVR